MKPNQDWECELPSSCLRNHRTPRLHEVSSKGPSLILFYISSRQMDLGANSKAQKIQDYTMVRDSQTD